MVVGACLATTLNIARVTVADPPQGAVVGWGRQVVAADLSHGFTAIAAGDLHSLALNTDGSITAWGSNEYGQSDVPAPNIGFVAVATLADHSLGLKATGSIAAWGINAHGQTDVPTPNADFYRNRGGQPSQFRP